MCTRPSCDSVVRIVFYILLIKKKERSIRVRYGWRWFFCERQIGKRVRESSMVANGRTDDRTNKRTHVCILLVGCIVCVCACALCMYVHLPVKKSTTANVIRFFEFNEGRAFGHPIMLASISSSLAVPSERKRSVFMFRLYWLVSNVQWSYQKFIQRIMFTQTMVFCCLLTSTSPYQKRRVHIL